MTRKPSLDALLRLFLTAVLLALAGCADGNIDDPDASSSVITIEKVDPSFVQSDVVKVVEPFSAETVDVTIRSILRGGSGGSDFDDVTLKQVLVLYDPPLSTGTASLSFNVTQTVPAGGTLTLQNAVVVSATDLIAGITPGTGTVATLLVQGEDLLGKPANAQAEITIEFQDFLDNNDADNDGIDDALDPAPLDPCIPNPCP